MTKPRTAVVPLLVVQPLEIDEPDWCAGHPDIDSDEARAQFKSDIDHKGPEHRLTHDGERLWTAFLGLAPYSSIPEARVLGVYVEQGGYARTLDADGLYDLAASFEAHADRLRELADQLAALLNGGSE